MGEVWYKLIFDVFIYADRENDDHAYRHLDKHYEMAILLNDFKLKYNLAEVYNVLQFCKYNIF